MSHAFGHDYDYRPTWDSIWIGLALSLSNRSSCGRASVGCVVVTSDNHRILAIGYNGGAKGLANRCDSDEPGGCGCLHAEENALIKMDYNDPSRKVLYTTTSPCLMCAKRIVNAKIDEVVYLDEYRKTEGLELLKEAGIPTRKLTTSYLETGG